jgi:hypothetical protein
MLAACDDVIELARSAPSHRSAVEGPRATPEGAAGVRAGGEFSSGGGSAVGVAEASTGTTPPSRAERRRTPPSVLPERDFSTARFERPEHVRGLYVNAWAAGSNRRMSELLDITRDTEVNALVIDIKDATGYLSHRSSVPLAADIGANNDRRIADLPALLDRLQSEGVYPIARIVIVKDPLLVAHRPEYAIQDTAGGPWVDRKGAVWLNPYAKDVWEYHVDLAREVADMGFPEIQWDYVRFPDAPKSDLGRAVYLRRDGRSRPEAIREFLDYSRLRLADLPAWTTADVFGVTTTYVEDVGTGQVWEDVIDVVDVALPMVYPSHYFPGSFGFARPNAHPYEVVRRAIEDGLKRSALVAGAGLTRPWLQDFTLGEPVYAGAEVRAQIQAAYDAGVQEWVLWNPGSQYTVAALEPVGGFEHEPLIRVAGVLAPVSRRHEVIDSVSAERARTRVAARSAAGSRAERFLAGLDTLSAPALDSSPALAPPPASAIEIVVPAAEVADSISRYDGPAPGRFR